MTTLAPARSVLSDEVLARCAERAPTYDRENRFFFEDFEELRKAGYLLLAVPKEFGGLGLSLAEVCQEQRRLARRSPPTALATNMHLMATGIAADLYGRGDNSQKWLLEEAGQGEVMAFGHAESGNDLEVIYAGGKAERVDGGYRFTGRKSFGSLTPVWTRLCIYGLDDSDPRDPKIVHAFLPRDTTGYHIKETWDTLGMRATRSDDTILDGAFVPDKYVIRVRRPGFAGPAPTHSF
jgi:alkylation response protein AidB-like acyl-CoA dehydrogenase